MDPPSLTSTPTNVMMPARRQPDSQATALNNFALFILKIEFMQNWGLPLHCDGPF